MERCRVGGNFSNHAGCWHRAFPGRSTPAPAYFRDCFFVICYRRRPRKKTYRLTLDILDGSLPSDHGSLWDFPLIHSCATGQKLRATGSCLQRDSVRSCAEPDLARSNGWAQLPLSVFLGLVRVAGSTRTDSVAGIFFTSSASRQYADL